MSRIARRFASLRQQGRGALIPYVEACDPDYDTSLAILRGMPGAGADLIEVGVPFSDPSADGPTIQKAALRGLKGGSSMKRVLEMVRAFREGDDETPIILMGYTNPIEAYGPERFCVDARKAGVDGLIVVDLPPEESDLLAGPAAAAGLDIIRLVAPTTPDERLPVVFSGASGFVYYVSITGVTGTRTASTDELALALPRLRKATDLPIAIGFGIRTPELAANAVRVADAAVVASALLNTLETTLDEEGKATSRTVPAVLEQLRGLADAVHAVKK
ncbi:Tryptophan synthase alpha chain [Gluconacetobacter sp. SXCC-1]|uniref:Tryptophan synthase alpha chain n=1 Tax=Komagataeibacter rhaeticus TaxID=215221 RepID=A0A181C6D6_9PROT|nr:tryptophan synthase subunit alpha [Komagataeibacter rhaeticus]ATU73979.1 tryptophan synthase subunit alpha [Komagataeibacter xylinus]EGG77826.1 Tryptophan synthase alpha chain [Gluconacetobacter sp. SXCC-1]QIP34132.1 tryptophan synthase subunit alpha [Komagataeibacter rhaeticus]QOC46641.1 tryptophan synthase subunit alpha [Komagataeibacter rhaeticus]WPP20993.1 tryptophan synthase subunit alpha [Komagataeibacter rhaeticus]